MQRYWEYLSFLLQHCCSQSVLCVCMYGCCSFLSMLNRLQVNDIGAIHRFLEPVANTQVSAWWLKVGKFARIPDSCRACPWSQQCQGWAVTQHLSWVLYFLHRTSAAEVNIECRRSTQRMKSGGLKNYGDQKFLNSCECFRRENNLLAQS